MKSQIKSPKSKIAFCFLLSAFCLLPLTLVAQNNEVMEEPVKTEIEQLQDQIENNASEIKKLKKFKVSGYVQAQFEVGQEFAQTKVGTAVAGNSVSTSSNTFNNTKDGKYDAETKTSNSDNFFRFGIRRGRIKFTYEETFGQAVFQLDITEKGVGFKDVYFKVSEPWLKIFSLTAGIFDRPFGDEIGYSSSRRESPERTVLHQELFPDDKDLGAMATIAGSKGSVVDGLKLEGGAFCGNGIAIPDNGKMDFIGRLRYDKKWSNITFGVGASMYLGHVRNRDTMNYTIQKNDEGVYAWKGEKVDPFKKNPRQYFGFDAQFAAQSSWGISNIRAEVVWGTQTSSSSRIRSPRQDFMQFANNFNYVRNFWGAHLYFIQDIYKTPLTVVLKYAYMNPNTKISAEEIKNKVDLPYNYLGFGLLVRCTANLRLMCYYDMPFNSTKNGFEPPKEDAKPAANFNHVLDYTNHVKEGVFTCRLQYKF
jgi:hypothetical protein